MNNISKRQQEIVDFIEDYQEISGTAPSLQDIATHFDMPESSVFAHIRALQRKNQLRELGDMQQIVVSRGLLPDQAPPGVWTLPLIGRVTAGLPHDSVEYREDEIAIANHLFDRDTEPSDCFALRITGESMRDVGIFDGDIAIVEASNRTPKPGDIVVALIDNETTVKSFYPNNNKIELRPANPDFKPQIYDAAAVTIQGIVIALQRKL